MPLPQEKRYSYADLLDWDEQERMDLLLPRHRSPCGES